MTDSAMPFLKTTTWRRIYAFLAVALAVFVMTMSFVGVTCHGFESPSTVSSIAPELQRQVEAPAVPDDVKAALAASDQRWANAAATAKTALAKYETTNDQLEKFVADHFAELMREAEAGESSLGNSTQTGNLTTQIGSEFPPAIQPPVMQPSTPKFIANPKWQELQKDLAELQRRRTDALINLLPTHPTVQALSFSIAEIEKQLKSVPEKIPVAADADSDPVARTPVAPPQIAVKPQPPVVKSVLLQLAPKWRVANAQFRELSDRATAAKQEYQQALADENSAWVAKSNAVEQAAKMAIPPPTPAMQVIYSGANTRLAIYLCGLIAVAAGFLVARRAQVAESIFQTAGEVRQKLGLSVLGVLPAAASQTSREPLRRESHWVKSSVEAAEWCLAVVALGLIVAALADRNFLLGLLADPVAACTQKFWC